MKGPPGRRAANTEPDHPSPPSATPEAIAQADRERKKRYKKSTHFLAPNAGMGWPHASRKPAPYKSSGKYKSSNEQHLQNMFTTPIKRAKPSL
jgi:hypothetical protein